LFHWAREFSTALLAGQEYSMLPRTIIISIINFKLFDCEEFHSEFQPLEVNRHELLSDKMCFHFYELPKIPRDIGEKDMLLLWLALFKAETEEELEKIKAMEVPVMSEAINAYYSVSASSEFKEKERLWAKARHDEAQALGNAEKRGEQKGRQEGRLEGRQEEKIELARNLLSLGDPIDKIIAVTSLTREEVEGLRI
jgi:predicted transposase/invertase (TIGR01784 family)